MLRSARLIRFLPLPVLLCLAALASAAVANVREYEVTGTSRAEKPAEDDALKAAVEKGIVELAGSSKVLEEKKDEIKKVLGKARRYIPSFRLLDRTEAGTTVILKISAKVNLDSLETDLIAAGVLASKDKPAVLTRVIVLPAPAKGGGPPWWAEGGAANAPDPLTSVMVEALRARGFDVVEPRRPEPDPDATVTPPPAPPPEMTNENLLVAARARDVDVAVKVTWEVQVAQRSLDGITFALAKAKVGPVEALAAKDGRVVATVSGEGVAGEALDAARASLGKVPQEIADRVAADAVKSAAIDAAARLSVALGDPTAKGGAAQTVKLVVAGLDSWVVYDRFERLLQRDLKAVRTATLHSIERGEAIFELALERGVTSQGLADEITKKEQDVFTLKVTETTPERVVIHLSR